MIMTLAYEGKESQLKMKEQQATLMSKGLYKLSCFEKRCRKTMEQTMANLLLR